MVQIQGKAFVNEFTEWVNAEIQKKGVSPRQASMAAGMDPSTLSVILNKGTANVESCLKLARYFGVSEARVLELAGHEVTPSMEERRGDLSRAAMDVAEMYDQLHPDWQRLLRQSAEGFLEATRLREAQLAQ